MIRRVLAAVLLIPATVLLIAAATLYGTAPDMFAIFEGDVLKSEALPVVVIKNADDGNPDGDNGDTSAVMELSLFGAVPIKNVTVSILQKGELIPSGETFGVKLFTDGVMVVGMSDIETAEGIVNPAYMAGIRTKDIITEINGAKVNTIDEISKAFEDCGGNPVSVKVKRQNEIFESKITPVKSSADGRYKVGLWVRDSTAGIGTLTFIDPASGYFGGLGHGICDVDTGELMPMTSGTVLKADIIDVLRGQKGQPGELIGVFDEGVTIGSLMGNRETGIFGKIAGNSETLKKESMPVASSYEIKEGAAEILANIDGKGVKGYSIDILKVVRGSGYTTKNMLIKVTDEELIEKTGGIVQGMSGSPIIQDGKIAGAVTHVLVNDPTKGYGIFIENMLEDMTKAAKSAA